MRMPWSLRVDLLVAILWGKCRSISIDPRFGDLHYVVRVPPTSVGRWKARRLRRREVEKGRI